jgi:hypothetical protein
MRRRLWLMLVVGAVACGGPTKPTPPPPPPVVGPATPPIIRSITVPVVRVETATDVTITAVVEDAETPPTQLTYLWSANVGAITGTGPTVTWRHGPSITGPLTAGVNVVITLTVIDKYQAVEHDVIVEREFRVVGQAAPFRVHDSVTELKALATRFLVDLFGNSKIPPADCLVDFSEVGKCAKGKADEYEDIVFNRSVVEILKVVIYSQTVHVNGFVSAAVVSDAEFFDKWLNPGPGQQEFTSTHADYVLTAIYDTDRWWLCESTYTNVRGASQYLDMLKKHRGGIIKK